MKRKWIILLILLLLAFAGYKYIYQNHRIIKSEQAKFEVSSRYIVEEFASNAVEAEKKYLDKTIIVSGIISEINPNSITLDGEVFCQFDVGTNQSLKINAKTKIKGRFIGYDDLLEQVKLDQCYILD